MKNNQDNKGELILEEINQVQENIKLTMEREENRQ